jgi:hypothetical protein
MSRAYHIRGRGDKFFPDFLVHEIGWNLVTLLSEMPSFLVDQIFLGGNTGLADNLLEPCKLLRYGHAGLTISGGVKIIKC